ncbi:glycosyltransferase family 2 protein [uncultured Williamsia sp.]|uniref:glycosyltransferase family 2 protein n=1 Tax=uncultured Williamsia sp. TaxID=259311 RepID=UPI00262D6EA7|nr:glycosyltransferase family 2 protein [uncultured Williamsia sp.]
MDFSFVMLTWNRPRFLDASLTSLSSNIAHRDRCEILVLDNGSDQPTRDVLSRHAGQQNVRVITLEENEGLQAYHRLFAAAKGKYIVVVDDDVLEFPPDLDLVFDQYMTAFPDYGFLCLNVVQNEHTDGAKPPADAYSPDVRGDLTVERGPAGGWCACFRRRHHTLLKPLIRRRALSMASGEDGMLSTVFAKYLRKKHGVIRDHLCFHASGPYYAAQHGHLDREIEKYEAVGLTDFVTAYETYRDTGQGQRSDDNRGDHHPSEPGGPDHGA